MPLALARVGGIRLLDSRLTGCGEAPRPNDTRSGDAPGPTKGRNCAVGAVASFACARRSPFLYILLVRHPADGSCPLAERVVIMFLWF